MSRVILGLDVATSTGACILNAEGGVLWFHQDNWVKIIDPLMDAVAGHGVTEIAFELPFVGDNRRTAIAQAVKVGSVVAAACLALDMKVDVPVAWEPQRWRKKIGAPMSGVAAKTWCVDRCRERGLTVQTPRGRYLIDAAEAFGIALAQYTGRTT